MDYWRGYMNWPLDPNWKCEICGSRELTWGLPHATCRCDVCHTQYRMRNEDDEVVSIPICQLRSEYKKSVKNAWDKLGIPIDEFSDQQCFELLKVEVR